MDLDEPQLHHVQTQAEEQVHMETSSQEEDQPQLQMETSSQEEGEIVSEPEHEQVENRWVEQIQQRSQQDDDDRHEPPPVRGLENGLVIYIFIYFKYVQKSIIFS